jgi:hypothetical protein
MEVRGKLQALAALQPEKDHLVSCKQEAGWIPQPVWTFWEEKFLFMILVLGMLHCVTRNLTHSDVPKQPIALFS